MDEPSQQVQQPSTSQSSKKMQWLKAVIKIIIIVLIVVFGIFIVLYFSTNINETGGMEVIKGMYKFKCTTSGRVYEQWGWTGQYCFNKSSEAGKTCAHDSDCRGGACQVSGNFFLAAKATSGFCSEADYSNWPHYDDKYKFPGCTIDQDCLFVD